MLKKLLFTVLCLFSVQLSATQSIAGFWKTVDEKTKKARGIVAVYEYNSVYYGRLIASYDDKTGKMDDTIYNPKSRAPGVEGDPYYSGLDFIWNLKEDDGKYKGKIMDPEKGNVYRAKLWVNNRGNLVVRGELLFFGRNQEWPKVENSDLPSGFKMPDTSKFVPDVHDVK